MAVPTLNSSYPQDATINYNGSVTFVVQISSDGEPAVYTYQWYKNSVAISGATNPTVTLSNQTDVGTSSIYCKVTNDAGSVTSRVATLTVLAWKPTYTYTGNASLIDDGDYHWRIKFLSSGVLTFSDLGNANGGIDVFLVGGGGGNSYGVGGCGGNTATYRSLTVNTGTPYTITIGAGGAGIRVTGGSSSAFGHTATGGVSGDNGGTGSGGGGGTDDWSTGGDGGTDGGPGKGKNNSGTYCAGQGTTTREFAESTGALYAGGGGGYGSIRSGSGGEGGGANAYGNAEANTGGGAGGTSNLVGRNGGSGIVIIRDHR